MTRTIHFRIAVFLRVFPALFWPALSRSLVVKCGPPPNSIENGQLESAPQEEYEYGQVVVYVCDEGYTLFGNPESHCSQNGSWTEGPRCKRMLLPLALTLASAHRLCGTCGPCRCLHNTWKAGCCSCQWCSTVFSVLVTTCVVWIKRLEYSDR